MQDALLHREFGFYICSFLVSFSLTLLQISPSLQRFHEKNAYVGGENFKQKNSAQRQAEGAAGKVA